jgi:hypothetical protein
MIDDNPPGEIEEKESVLPPETQKIILYITGVIILMAASFVAGSYWGQRKAATPTPFSQLPTPVPMGTPIPVPESGFTMINFKSVSDTKKAEVISAFNTETCACNCKMSVAECIVKDPNCPYWKEHVTKMQTALGNGIKPDLSKAGKQTMPFAPAGAFQMPQPQMQNMGKH